MNSSDIVNDIYCELPLFSKIHSMARLKNYFTINHIGIISITLAVLGWVL